MIRIIPEYGFVIITTGQIDIRIFDESNFSVCFNQLIFQSLDYMLIFANCSLLMHSIDINIIKGSPCSIPTL